MSRLRRLVCVRHGETVANSSERLIGRGDPDLSETGRAQLRAAARVLRPERIGLVVASPLRRSWQSAWLLAGGVPVRLEPSFREVDFGRWEGLTLAEIEAQDPVLFRAWREGGEDFAYPGGESRSAFRARVHEGLERVLATPVHAALLVLHKGVIRLLAEELLGEALEPERPALGDAVLLTREPDGRWVLGRRSSDPASLAVAG